MKLEFLHFHPDDNWKVFQFEAGKFKGIKIMG